MYLFSYKKTTGLVCLIPSAYFLYFAYEGLFKSNDYTLSRSDGIIFLIISIIPIILWILALKYRNKCPNCKKLGAMKTTNKELIGKEQTFVSVYDRQSNGYADHSATMYQYHIHRKCEKCGYTDYLECDEIKKN